jgi:hypothetical protein
MGMGRAPLDYALLPWRVLLEGGSDYTHFAGDAKLLLLDANQSFFLEREALANGFLDASQLADWLPDGRVAVYEPVATR